MKNEIPEGHRMNANQYFSELTAEFPALKSAIDSEDPGLIHLRMELFSDYTTEQIKARNHKELQRCFAFQDSQIERMNKDLFNALEVSYCESLLLGDCADEMKDISPLMPTNLEKVYTCYESYYSELTKNSKS